jgi:uncharacterized membrane protein
MVMKRGAHDFVDRELVRAAINAVEQRTTARIHVSIAPPFWGDVHRTTKRAFKHHRLAHTPDRNGVLFFLVPSRRRFVILGDIAAHEKVGQQVWDHVAAVMEEGLRSGDPTEALIRGIEELGQHLATHFPRQEAVHRRSS